MRGTNLTILAKLGWRLLQQPDALWATILRNKYCQGRSDVDMFTKSPRSSQTWKGIVDGSKMLCKGLRFAIGNGSSTLFWFHNWLVDNPLIDFASTAIPDVLLGATVAELHLNGAWNWDVISPILPTDICCKLMSITVVDSEDAVDKVFWNEEASGLFSTKSAHFLHRQKQGNPFAILWKAIWRVPTHQRVRNFLYLLAKDCILCNLWPTNKGNLRVRNKDCRPHSARNLSSDPGCPRCNAPETALHLVRDCQAIKDVWLALSGNVLPSNLFVAQGIAEWIQSNISNMGQWASIFAYMTWLTWKCRNGLVFEGNDTVGSLSAIVVRQSEAYDLCSEKASKIDHNPHVNLSDVQLRWSLPPQGWTMLNVDGASKGNPDLAAGGGLFRTDSGEFLTAFTFSCGACLALTAELWAILHGLRKATSLGISKLILESDSLSACQLLRSRNILTHPDFYLLKQCWRVIDESPWEIQINHVRRNANRVADALAQ